MSKKLFFATSTILLTAPIFAFTSCKLGQQDATLGKLIYGQSVSCQSKQEIDNLFQNNMDQWPQESKNPSSTESIKSDDEIMYFDLIASICKYSSDKSIIGFTLVWNSDNSNIKELSLIDANQKSMLYSSVEYLQENNKVVLSLTSNNDTSITIPSFTYGNIVIE